MTTNDNNGLHTAHTKKELNHRDKNEPFQKKKKIIRYSVSDVPHFVCVSSNIIFQNDWMELAVCIRRTTTIHAKIRYKFHHKYYYGKYMLSFQIRTCLVVNLTHIWYLTVTNGTVCGSLNGCAIASINLCQLNKKICKNDKIYLENRLFYSIVGSDLRLDQKMSTWQSRW